MKTLDITTSTQLGASFHERVRSAISHLNPNDREVWVRAGTCVKSEFGEAGFDLWDAWGSQAESHKASSAKSVWKSIKSAGKLTIGSLFYDAKQAGWKDDTAYKKPTKEQIDARNAAAAARREQAEAEEAVLREAAALRARALWDAAAPATDHPYLTKKGVQAHGLRVGTWERIDADTGEVYTVTNNGLLLPLRDLKGKLWSLQCIEPEAGGKKLYLAGGKKQGSLHTIGSNPLQHYGSDIFVLGEGYATCASVHESTGHMVLVCFDTSNLLAVAKALRQVVPEALILFAADNDSHTDGNPGVKAATKAMLEVGGWIAIPPAGDFNDLYLCAGPGAVAARIQGALSAPAMRMSPRIVATQKGACE